MGVRPGISISHTNEPRHAMSARIPIAQHQQLLNIAEWYECSFNEALAHCIKQAHEQLFPVHESRSHVR